MTLFLIIFLLVTTDRRRIESERYWLASKDKKGLTEGESNGGAEPDHNETTSTHNH